MNPSSASRLLATLEQGGLVARDPGGPYRLGLHILALADRVLSRLDVREPAARSCARSSSRRGRRRRCWCPRATRPSPSTSCRAGRAWSAWPARAPEHRPRHRGREGRARLRAGRAGLARRLHRAHDHRSGAARRRARDRARAGLGRGRGGARARPERARRADRGTRRVLVAVLGLQGPAARFTLERRRAVLPALLTAATTVSRSLGGT